MRRALFLMGFLCLATSTALAQDPVKVAPNNNKVLLENDHVRVLDVRIKPGEKVPMHSHPAKVNYILSDFKLKFTYPDGKTEVREGTAGMARWNEAVTHAPENVGTTEFHAVEIELKGAATPAGTALAQDPVKVAPNNHKVLLENDRVRVLEFHSKPGEKIGMHSHPDYIIYSFTAGKTKFTYPDGKTEERQGQAGTATWRAAETHASEFLGPGEARVLLIELKGKAAAAKPAKAQPAKKTTM